MKAVINKKGCGLKADTSVGVRRAWRRDTNNSTAGMKYNMAGMSGSYTTEEWI